MEEVAHIECPLCRSRLMDATKAITKITHITIAKPNEPPSVYQIKCRKCKTKLNLTLATL